MYQGTTQTLVHDIVHKQVKVYVDNMIIKSRVNDMPLPLKILQKAMKIIHTSNLNP